MSISSSADPDDVDWRVMQAYCNYWLKWGMVKQAEVMELAQKRFRMQRFKQQLKEKESEYGMDSISNE